MSTKIEFQTWRGGDGSNDPRIMLGYCVESPAEVLSRLYSTHYIHSYRGLYRPVEYDFPNNVTGLVITEVTAQEMSAIGLSVTGILDNINTTQALIPLRHTRTQNTYREGLAMARSWHEYTPGAAPILDEVERITCAG